MPGFYSDIQQQNFRAANTRVRRGGEDAVVCGARTRTGSACQQIPLKDSNRCLRHCGPKAAREWRDRQQQDYFAGRISHEEWQRAEDKRAVNRLRERWKKNPWLPGATIDLGEHEGAFQQDTGIAARGEQPLPPAVIDWLRWRYRRLTIDRRRDAEWLRALRDELPRRLAAAGAAPANAMNFREQQQQTASTAIPFRVDPPKRFSKRQQLDQPKAPAKQKIRSFLGQGGPKVPPAPDENDNDFAIFANQHRKALLPLFEKCRTPSEQLAVAKAMRAFVANPNDPAARDRWLHTLFALRER